ncbi:hypothetical protein [uncultured Helicobacter sp.]|uniref:hypothetical protein n=1 Tax=uncultured Helicobacter sp. TaxID=175537 RepID=UPI00374F63C0
MSLVPHAAIQKAIITQFDIFEVYRDFEKYFEKQKNPKIFMFFITLITIASNQQQTKIFFNILQMSYRYDVCEKTIKLWLKELERLELVSFSYKNKQLYFLEILDYKQSKPYKSLILEQQTQDLESAPRPTRFYKNVAQILREIQKSFSDKTFEIDGEQYNLQTPLKRDKRKFVSLDFQNKTDCQFFTTLTYEHLTNQSLPPINNPYHLRIIKSNLKKHLELLSS